MSAFLIRLLIVRVGVHVCGRASLSEYQQCALCMSFFALNFLDMCACAYAYISCACVRVLAQAFVRVCMCACVRVFWESLCATVPVKNFSHVCSYMTARLT